MAYYLDQLIVSRPVTSNYYVSLLYRFRMANGGHKAEDG